ncbi:MAG: fibronectin type III domain-containing protein, partial [Bacteroidales bacterium]|nr:fibronectin type III domain-containing protein [Bacteroidales bacterium]
MRKLFSFTVLIAMFLPWVMQAQTTPAPASLPYTCGFEDATENGNWTIVNGNSTNKFFIGTAVNNGGTQSLYISNDNGVSNAYTVTSAGYVFAYREISVTTAGSYTFNFDWKANGESTYDFLRVFLIPANATDTIVPRTGTTSAHTGITASATPSSWIALDGGTKLNLSSTWNTFLSDEIPLTAGTYKLAFYWRNDNSTENQPPAAIDNISVQEVLCSRPTGLTITSVDAYSATISWTATAGNTFMYVNDTAGAPHQWNDDATAVNTNTVTLTDLTPNTAYTFYLQCLCGNDTSAWIPISFRTSCIPVSDDMLPYHESFETWAAGAFDPCYVATNNHTSNANYPSVNTSYHSDSLKSLYLYSAATYATWLAFPAFESPLTSLQISFDIYKTTVTDYPLLVGVMSNRNDISTFDTITTVRCDEASTWQHFTIPLSLYEGNGLYIAFVSPNGVASSNYIDNIVVDNLSACPDPLNVEITDITETSITLEWQSTGASGYLIEYGNIGFIPSIGMGNIENASGETFTISALDGNTAYDLYLRSDCSGDTGNWIGPLTFRTACPAVTDISINAYIENFDSYNAVSNQSSYSSNNELPNCWNFWTDGTNGSTGAYFPRIYRGTAVSPTNNDNNLQMGVMNYTGTTTTTLGYVTERGKIKIATLPAFSEPLSNVTISFEAKTTAPSATNAYNDTLFVAVATTDSTYIPLTYFTSSTDVIMAEVELGQYASLIPTSGNARLALVFKAGSFSGSAVRYCGIDNVMVMKTPTCKKPYDGAITNVTPTTATYIFTDSINTNNYEIIWNTINNIELTLADGANYTTATDTTGEITNLEPATTYYAWARSACPGEYSPWIELGHFTTECYPLDTLPFYENFDSYTTDVATAAAPAATYPNHTLPSCWKFINMSQTSSTYPQ